MNINIILVVVLILLACSAVKGYKNGLVHEVISIIAMIVAIVAIALVASAIGNYISKDFGDMIIAALFFVVLMLVAHLSKILVLPVKFLSKLPIISWLNKLAGLCLGLTKGVVSVWIIFIIVDMFESLSVSQYFLAGVKNNEFLTFLYQNNYITHMF